MLCTKPTVAIITNAVKLGAKVTPLEARPSGDNPVKSQLQPNDFFPIASSQSRVQLEMHPEGSSHRMCAQLFGLHVQLSVQSFDSPAKANWAADKHSCGAGVGGV